jgi:hypothetical protein
LPFTSAFRPHGSTSDADIRNLVGVLIGSTKMKKAVLHNYFKFKIEYSDEGSKDKPKYRIVGASAEAFRFATVF